MTNDPGATRGTSTTQGIAQILGSRLGTLLLALAVQVLLARMLGPEGRGAYDAALLWGTLAIMLLNPGLESSSVYFVSSGTMRLRECMSGAAWLLALGLLVAISGTAIVLGGRPPILDGFLAKAPGLLLLLGAITGLTTLALQTTLAMSTAGQQFGIYSSGQMIHRAVQLVGALLLIAAFGMGPTGAVLAIVAADLIIVGTVATRLLRQSPGSRATEPRRAAASLLAYGRRFYFGKLGGQFNFRIGPLLLAASASATDLGLYGQASAVAIQYMSVPESVYVVLLPKMSSNTASAARQTAQTARFMAIMGLLVMAASLAAATPVFRLLFSEDFLPAVPVFQVLLAAFVLRAVGKVHEPYLLALDRPGLVSLAVAVGLAANVILLAALYQPHGLTGVAWALFGNYLLSTGVLMGAALRLGKIPIRQYMCWQAEDTASMRTVWTAIVKSGRR